MEREKRYNSMYDVESIILKPVEFFYFSIDLLREELLQMEKKGATHVEVECETEEYSVTGVKLSPLKEREESDEEYQRRLEREQRRRDALKAEAENTRIKELKQLQFLKAKYPEEK